MEQWVFLFAVNKMVKVQLQCLYYRGIDSYKKGLNLRDKDLFTFLDSMMGCKLMQTDNKDAAVSIKLYKIKTNDYFLLTFPAPCTTL